jgi:hypothetical protein
VNPDDLAIGAHYRHKKTGGKYQLIMFATIEATMTPAVIYGANKNGEPQRWVRPLAEFCDGRFEPVDMSTVPFREHRSGGGIKN